MEPEDNQPRDDLGKQARRLGERFRDVEIPAVARFNATAAGALAEQPSYSKMLREAGCAADIFADLAPTLPKSLREDMAKGVMGSSSLREYASKLEGMGNLHGIGKLVGIGPAGKELLDQASYISRLAKIDRKANFPKVDPTPPRDVSARELIGQMPAHPSVRSNELLQNVVRKLADQVDTMKDQAQILETQLHEQRERASKAEQEVADSRVRQRWMLACAALGVLVSVLSLIVTVAVS